MMPVFRGGGAVDLPAIARIQSVSPSAAHWDPAEYLDHDLWVATLDAAVAGFLVLRSVAPGEAEILNLAIDPEFRRRGLATGLLEAALRHFQGVVFLEVRASNSAARKLYQTVGFHEVGARPSYYENPPESAIVMKFHSC